MICTYYFHLKKELTKNWVQYVQSRTKKIRFDGFRSSNCMPCPVQNGLRKDIPHYFTCFNSVQLKYNQLTYSSFIKDWLIIKRIKLTKDLFLSEILIGQNFEFAAILALLFNYSFIPKGKLGNFFSLKY